MPYIVTDECILCGACVAGCPSGAVQEGETKCQINAELCIECGTCEQNCPSGAIIFVEQEESVLQCGPHPDHCQDAEDQCQRCR